MNKTTPEKKILCGLDIGTTKICSIIGHYDEETSEFHVLGIGKVPSTGMKSGKIIDMDTTKNSIKKSVAQALDNAGVDKLEGATIGIAGDHIHSIDTQRSIDINHIDSKNAANIICRDDIQRLETATKNIDIGIDQQIIHVIPQEYIINDSLVVKKPLGMSASKLTLKAHVIIAGTTNLKNLTNCVQDSGLNVNDVVLEPLASANAVLTYDQKDLGVALIDIGGGTTDITVFEHGHLAHTGIVGYGGEIISKDIASLVQTSYTEAERIKKEYGFASAKLAKASGIKEFYVKPVNGKVDIAMNSFELSQYIEARVSEIFNFANTHVDKYQLNAGIVLTGGGSLLKGAEILGEEIFGCNCQVGYPIRLNGLEHQDFTPEYATGIGLLDWENIKRDKPRYLSSQKKINLWTKIKDRISDFF